MPPGAPIRPGPRNLLTDVPGLRVGNAQDEQAQTGVTVVLVESPATAAADVRGGAPGTRETEALQPAGLVERVDAVVLSGGSAFGLDAASAVMAWLAARGRGFAVGRHRVPIVPAAILFDLGRGRDWGTEPPYRGLAQAACDEAGERFALGNAGAGLGAVAGRLKGGLGSASAILPDGTVIGAVVAVNSVGSAVVPGTRTLWAWAVERDGEFGGMGPPPPLPPDWREETKLRPVPGASTTIGVVATDAVLDRAQLLRVVRMAHDGIARAVRPSHGPFDGDTLFALATATSGRTAGPAEVAAIGAQAAECVERAIGRAVYSAAPLADIPALCGMDPD